MPVPAGLVTSTHWTNDAGDSVRSVSLLLDGAMTLQVVEQQVAQRSAALTITDLVSREHALAGINGGYFKPDFTPCGLVLVQGRESSALGSSALLSGCLGITPQGAISLRATSDGEDPSWRCALQAGPFLIDPGGHLGIRPATSASPIAPRSMIARSAQGRIALIATSATTLYALARCLHDHPEGFGLADVERCLNLDGGPSTSLVIAGAPPHPAIPEGSRVRTALVVVAKP